MADGIAGSHVVPLLLRGLPLCFGEKGRWMGKIENWDWAKINPLDTEVLFRNTWISVTLKHAYFPSDEGMTQISFIQKDPDYYLLPAHCEMLGLSFSADS